MKLSSAHTSFDYLVVRPLLLLQKTINYFKLFLLPSFVCWKILFREKIAIVHLNNTVLRPQQWILASLFTGANAAGDTALNSQETFDTWDCDDMCEAVDNASDVLCLVDAYFSDGKNILAAPECPSWTNYQNVDTEDCIACASVLNLTRDDCLRYRSTCYL